MRALDPARAEKLEALCEAIVPGSSRVGPVAYIDALLAAMPEPVRSSAVAAIDALSTDTLADRQFTPEFAFVRALAIEAFYSDFVEPGRDAEGAWAEIGFDPPAARRLRKDWSWVLQ